MRSYEMISSEITIKKRKRKVRNLIIKKKKKSKKFRKNKKEGRNFTWGGAVKT